MSKEKDTKKQNSTIEKKRKIILIIKEWEQKIKEYHKGTVSSYIHIAIQEKMKRDGIL